MDFRLRGLPWDSFAPLFEMTDDELRRCGSRRLIAAAGSIYPCRVSLMDAAPGDEVLLTNFAHVPEAATPYRSVGPIFVRRGAGEMFDRVNEVPSAALDRTLSLRAYDADNMISDARLATGRDLLAAVREQFATVPVAYVHVHHAAYGCYQFRVDPV